ncbi:MAG: proteinase inhibitor serpin [Deltaproteobacteria bacterium]|nr:proteinase inhibitor serpin [Deltaproteobacteria bacterium]
MNRLFAAFTVMIMIAVWGFSFPGVSGAAAAAHKSVADGNTDVAIDLYRELGKNQGNLFFSPFSISSALAMTYAGAREDTAAQMKEALHFQLEQSGLNSAFRSLNQKLAEAAERSDQKLNIANALVLTGGRVSNTYEKILRTYYNAEIFGGDLGAINGWVKRKTEGKIDTILEQLSANSVCVILNAIYFKGTWDAQFDKTSTLNAPFSVSTDKQVKIPLMHRKDNYKLLEQDKVQIISLPYKGKALSMVVILPKEVDGLANVEEQLKAKDIKELLAKLDKQPDRKVSVYFPKFRMETKYDLGGPFQKMGMKDAFSSRADFTGMGWQKGYLWIGQIKHKAFVEVNEEGTEAAAATAVEMVTKAMPARELVFRADHPFFFMIRDNETGTILFMGRMADPATQR